MDQVQRRIMVVGLRTLGSGGVDDEGGHGGYASQIFGQGPFLRRRIGGNGERSSRSVQIETQESGECCRRIIPLSTSPARRTRGVFREGAGETVGMRRRVARKRVRLRGLVPRVVLRCVEQDVGGGGCPGSVGAGLLAGVEVEPKQVRASKVTGLGMVALDMRLPRPRTTKPDRLPWCGITRGEGSAAGVSMGVSECGVHDSESLLLRHGAAEANRFETCGVARGESRAAGVELFHREREAALLRGVPVRERGVDETSRVSRIQESIPATGIVAVWCWGEEPRRPWLDKSRREQAFIIRRRLVAA
ncbi:hypothetical protein FB45DRAFT_1109340 [Roridomyces roridus]|uniref:Uncharacterized protein n=1 Tax=Roridomyces roridus TaxID=1738132 RepID=A0AAD7BAD3_9AGAR|nr:hypothetical protein FB45DRAFT_1109340 [Roridomyces roridus]